MESIGAKGGMSLTSGFDVAFKFSDEASWIEAGGYYKDSKLITMLCDEAQLPNVQAGVAQVTGRYLGEGPIYYPHTRIYTDFSLGFMLDRDLTPLKFMNDWMEQIFGDNFGSGGLQPNKTNRINRLKYPDTYTCTLAISKTEPDPGTYNGYSGGTYLLENCYPYSIDAVPLAYGSSQVTRLTCNFYYTRHTFQPG